MPFNIRRQPLPLALRKGLKLANEWRDTLFYGFALFIGVLNLVFGWHISSAYFFEAISLREYFRLGAWILGHDRNVININSANFVAMTSMTLWFLARATQHGQFSLALMERAPLTISGMAVAITAYFQVGGMRVIFKTYQDVLFDWPRKILPPRKPGKNPALEWIKNLWESWVGGPLTQPGRAFQPISKPLP